METAFRSEERYTQASFFDWLQARPAHDANHYELLDGHIVMTPPAGLSHSSIALRIAAALLHHTRSLGLGKVYESSAGFDLPSGDTVEPDVSFVSSARIEASPQERKDSFGRVVPDLVVEVLSRATARYDRIEKKGIYEKNGVREYWIVAPERRSVSVHRMVDGKYAPAVEIVSGVIESAILPELGLTLDEIFDDA